VVGKIFHVSYDIEGSDVGYRWFERTAREPLFPFGHGLSFTRFEASGLAVKRAQGTVLASVNVRNTGAREGTETVQLYVRPAAPGGFASRLAGFARIRLAPGEQRRVELKVDPRLLARFDAESRQWRIEPGRYVFRVARDARAEGILAPVELPARRIAP